MLTNREVGPLDEGGVDLPAVRGEHLLDSLEGAEHHAMAHMDQAPPAHSLDHLRIAQPGQGHPTGLGSVTKRLLCIPVESPYECKTRGEERGRRGPRAARARCGKSKALHTVAETGTGMGAGAAC